MEDRIKILEDLIDEHEASVTKLAFTYVKDWSTAQDIAQEVFISVFNGLETFQHNSAYKTWIYRITVNKCKDMLGSAYFRRNVLTESVARIFKGSEADTADKVIRMEEMKGISRDVFSLPEKYREIIILYYYEELTTEEISELLDIGSSTIRTRLARARHKLQSLSKRRDQVEQRPAEKFKS
ncbi:sigma-70 family RNA polymerase sigma factor [Rossellomorea aquimaris]|uniref:sigma-70 family RNA polymerase sigma factor n=1 Tax=Bacillaceae TaxID=186817 RepID=UPI0013B05D76|nr:MULTISPECIES: sigma-70 family RNA polymerase sigma factor [Bacillaceae]